MLTLVFPYAAGTIFGSFVPESQSFWGSVGGYLGATPFVMAILGLRGRVWRRAKIALTIFWLAVGLRIFGISHLLTKVWNFIPGIDQTASYRYSSYRYSSPALSFATVILVALGLHGFYRVERSRLAFGGTALVSLAILGSLAIQARSAVRLLTDVPMRHPVAVASVGTAVLLV